MNTQELYTMEQWEADRTFSASPGQEVTEEIYNEMMNCIPPLRIPRSYALDRGFFAGFLMGEPHESGKDGKALYLAFGNRGNKYYYLGLAPAEH